MAERAGWRVAAGWIVLALVGVTPGAQAQPSEPPPGDASIVEVPVSFEVLNTNRSAVPCPTDGRPYEVHGHLVGPRSEFEGPADRDRAVTVLLTGWDEAEWTWRFQEVPGYDHPYEMAKLGHTSLSIDMLGYGRSGHPHGFLSCYGSEADVLHQIIGQLRESSYRVHMDGVEPIGFSTVLVSARDTGPFPAIITAYTWPGDIDGLSTQIIAHQGFTNYIIDLFARRHVSCALGGQNHDAPPDDPDDHTDDGPRGGGYILFGPPNEQFRTDLFHEERADPAVIDAVLRLRTRNPCGHLFSTLPTIRMDLTRMSEVEVPVLLVFPGPDDPVVSRDGQEREAANYSGSDDVTTAWLDSGHFFELEECAPAFRALYANWAHERWHIGRSVPDPVAGPDGCVTEVRVKEGT